MCELWLALPLFLVLDLAEPGLEALAGLGVLALGTISARLVRRFR